MVRVLSLLLLLVPHLWCAEIWKVRLEEPTGLYRRSGEVVGVPLSSLGGARGPFRVVDPVGVEAPHQVAGDTLLFPASLMPGELPVYRVFCCDAAEARFQNEIVLKQIGLRRVELGNARFRMIIDTGAGAVVEAYALEAGPQRVLNLVETTPENPAALKDDIHASKQRPFPPTPVAGDNTGWTSLGGSGEFSSVEMLESGPLRGRLRLWRGGEEWLLEWTAGSRALRWRALGGFRFAAVSASPYLPFDRFLGGSEYEWPSGPEHEEPPDHEIGARQWRKLPGGHAVYYRQAENYGALGIVALDERLEWSGIGTRRFEARAEGPTEVVITFPAWKGNETALEARRENRVARQPVLVTVSGPEEGKLEILRNAVRDPQYEARRGTGTVFRPRVFSLDGEWELAWGEKGAGPSSEWRRVRVPGSVHTSWLDASQIYTRNASWVSTKEWWYRKRFRPPVGFGGERVRLQFDATDYYADAWLNGRWLGRHEGYIDPYEYDVTDLLQREAENEIRVRVWTPVSYYWRHRPYTIKGSYGAVDQKPDDITAIGITRGVRLVAGAAARIRGVAVNTRLAGEAAEVEVEVETEEGIESQVELALSPRNFSDGEGLVIRAPVQGERSRYVIRVERPQLWWTWDHGTPNLYTLEARLLDQAGKAVDGRTLAVGIREIEKIGWHFYLNRRRMFIRGTNYYYNLFLSEMDRAAYERDVRMMRGMNVNMIRLHCHFTNPEFYELADEAGILVWQDYLEAWYPHDRGFSLRAAALYDNHIRMVRNHASVAIWATSDEEDLENYHDLTKHLAPRPFLLDPQRRPVVRSTGRFGDAHVYHGWYGGSIWQYGDMEEEFVSELGATALPNYESLVKFLPSHWPIRDHMEDWIFHKLQIGEAMRAWGEPGGLSLRDYIPRTQSYVARLFQLALERQRRRKPQTGGILHFHAIDIWPSVTMAALDFYRVPTKAYYTVQRSFEPVLASIEYRQDCWRTGEEVRCGIWAVNDLWREIPGATIRWRIVDVHGARKAEGGFPAPMAPDSSHKVGETVWIAGPPGSYELRAEVLDSTGNRLSENVFEFEVVAR